jgi:hypothetical protein
MERIRKFLNFIIFPGAVLWYNGAVNVNGHDAQETPNH